MSDRPACYPSPPAALLSGGPDRAPLLDVLTTPVPHGVFDSPVDGRHVLCLHLGEPVPVSYRMDGHQRQGVRLHGQFCVVPAGSSTRWVVSQPARSLLLRLTPTLLGETSQAMGLGTGGAMLAPSIHIRDPQIERIGWMMQAEDHDAYPGGRLFTDSLATALAARLLALQSRRSLSADKPGRALPAWRLRRVQEYIEAHLDEPLSLAELAAVAGYSASHFKALFKQATDVPVHRYVLERRVERARHLLEQGEQPIAEIALAAGFSHPSHMARCLRRALGLSPSQLMHDAAVVRRIAH
ncbi:MULTISPECIES: AraC family transcriptional regulator [unclassified Lysobacter]|uniref:helix-turn-helix domain-containing protein n=1 Tax=unclassified Lysobacter TaxID=2635362 RepID=UPI0006F8FC64|nr:MULTISPECIES: AraC family transcriptional regulator [unclassified Lysobacter]KRC36733.1 AraC family transcriptional regulator [Lysobacter sp. Root76]KRD66829.1 AraC family transcriptional regulator [Lysobacter sp. Root96]